MKRKRTLADLVPPGAKFKRDLGLLALWFALFVLLGSFLIFVIRYKTRANGSMRTCWAAGCCEAARRSTRLRRS